MAGNRDLEFQKINRSAFQSFFHKFYSRFINGEGQVCFGAVGQGLGSG